MTALLPTPGSRGRRASPQWLVCAVTVWAVGDESMTATQDIAGLTVSRVLLGIGQSLFAPVAIALPVDRAVDRAGVDAHARALALFTSGSTISRSTALQAKGGCSLCLRRWVAVAMLRRGAASILTALPDLPERKREKSR